MKEDDGMAIIYLATSGEYDDYRVEAAFTRREDAEAFELGDSVEEIELRDGPAEVRTWHQLRWYQGTPLREGIPGHRNPNPMASDRERRIWDGNPDRLEVSYPAPGQVDIQGWDPALIRARMDELMGEAPASS
jgi:hypothetical protein